jgi:hypothetical protein
MVALRFLIVDSRTAHVNHHPHSQGRCASLRRMGVVISLERDDDFTRQREDYTTRYPACLRRGTC